jgi:dTMP kinase
MRGRFIVLEGADGVGTTTQSQALAALLKKRGRRVHITCEPSTGIIGRLIRGSLNRAVDHPHDRKALALLFAADRLDHVSREIEPQLAAGVDVISDRYVLSSLVYQSLDAPLDWVESINEHAPKPHATVLMTLPPEVALKRLAARKGRDIFEDDTSQLRVHARYTELASVVHAMIVDGNAPVEAVTERILAVLDGARLWG